MRGRPSRRAGRSWAVHRGQADPHGRRFADEAGALQLVDDIEPRRRVLFRQELRAFW